MREKSFSVIGFLPEGKSENSPAIYRGVSEPVPAASPIRFSADGSLLAIGTIKGEVILWDVDGEKEIWRRTDYVGSLAALRFSPDGQRLFSAGRDTVKMWSIRTGALQFELNAHESAVKGIYITSDSRTLTTVGWDRTIKQWRTATDEDVNQIRERWRQTTGAKAVAETGE